jgi:hypothetical protein
VAVNAKVPARVVRTWLIALPAALLDPAALLRLPLPEKLPVVIVVFGLAVVVESVTALGRRVKARSEPMVLEPAP